LYTKRNGKTTAIKPQAAAPYLAILNKSGPAQGGNGPMLYLSYHRNGRDTTKIQEKRGFSAGEAPLWEKCRKSGERPFPNPCFAI
jgi:hypothetical protein